MIRNGLSMMFSRGEQSNNSENRNWMKTLTKFCMQVTVILSLLFIISTPQQAYALAEKGIMNNGLNDLYIDINDSIFKQFATYGYSAYEKEGCGFYASARARQITGKGNMTYNGYGWYYTQADNLGFTKGPTFSYTYKALACYENHISVIEGVLSNGKILVSEGSYDYDNKHGTYGSDGAAAHGGCIIHTQDYSQVVNSDLIGFVYLDVELMGSVPQKPRADIKSGVYVIHSAWNDNICLDIAGDSTENNANIQLYERTTNTHVQDFRVIKWDEDSYCIKSIHNGRWLDCATPIKDNSNVKLYNTNEATEDFWFFEDAGEGYVYIRNLTGLYLDVQGDQAINRANIQLYHFVGNNSQKWRMEDVTNYGEIEDGIYTIQSGLDNNYLFDIAGDSMENDANIQLYHATGSPVQQFIFTKHGSYYSVQSVYNHLWLDIKLPVKDRANVKLYQTGTALENQWVLENAGDGYYYIRSNRDFYLDIYGDAATDHANIQMYHFNGSNVQKWKLSKTSFTVNYDANGGTNAPAAQTKTVGSQLTLTTAVPTRSGYDFIHWNTALDDSGTSYNGGDTYSTDADMTLYAIWSNGEVSEIIVPESMTVVVGEKAKLNITTKPAGIDLSTLTYEFSNPSCATIDDEYYIHAVYTPEAHYTDLTITAPNGITATVQISIWSNISDLSEIYINDLPMNRTMTIDVYKVGQTVPYRLDYEVTNGYDPGYDLTLNGEYHYPFILNHNSKTITFIEDCPLVPGVSNSMMFGISGYFYMGYGDILVTDDQKSMYLPEGLSVIEDEAFNGSAARYFFLPDGVTEIGDNAFPADSFVFLKTENLNGYGFKSGNVIFVENGTVYNEAFASVHNNYYARRGTRMPEVWSEWSAWSETAASESETRHVKTKIQYRSASISQVTKYTDWSSWSSWSADSESISDANLKQQQTRTVYPYYCFRCSTCGWQSPYWGTGKCTNGHDIASSDFDINVNEITTTKSECEKYDSIKYLCVYNGQNWFYWDDGSSPDLQTPKTQYSYRTRNTYQEPSYGTWSAWGDESIAETENLAVETRVMYSYQDRIQ